MTNPTISGLQEAQHANLRHIMAMKPTGAFGRVVQITTAAVHRYSVAITHVDSGSLRASHRMLVSGLHGEVYIDPSASNPRSGKRTSLYGPIEHARGGEHAFYARTEHEYGQKAVAASVRAGFTAELR